MKLLYDFPSMDINCVFLDTCTYVIDVSGKQYRGKKRASPYIYIPTQVV